MLLVAHSPPKTSPDREPHLYREHIEEALDYGKKITAMMLDHCSADSEPKGLWIGALIIAVLVHDLGKLDRANQEILTGQAKGRLPVDHIDAGVAVATGMKNELAAWLVRAHHSPGLPNKSTERKIWKRAKKRMNDAQWLRGKRHHRETDVDDIDEHVRFAEYTNQNMADYQSAQESACGPVPRCSANLPDNALRIRLLMSCLVDADHSSSASYSTQSPMPDPNRLLINLSWDKRLEKLRRYVSNISENSSGSGRQRNQLRKELFEICSTRRFTASLDSSIVSCAAPVGLGKTTAVLAYLLRRAEERQLRRIFVIAPFTNIISQTARKLRKAIALDGENPDDVVVEHHHRVDLSDYLFRQYTTLWRAPVIVTTAVQFFESLASAIPTPLRKLHALPGSAIFLDESHACLPPHLLRISWYWIQELSQCWNCHFVMASGSQVRFLRYPDLVGNEGRCQTIPEIMDDEYYTKAQQMEHKRVRFERLSDNGLNTEQFIDELITRAGETKEALVILNTVQSAAVIARSLSDKLGDQKCFRLAQRRVLHLSTALTPNDREKVINELERRQENSEWTGKSWFVVATSCIEAGVDLDFTHGFRERCSVTSFFQTAGRINRHGNKTDAVLYDFTLLHEAPLVAHPGFEKSIQIFQSLWSQIQDSVTDINQLSTVALCREAVTKSGDVIKSEKLLEDEQSLSFQDVQKDFHIISADTRTVVVDDKLIGKIESGIPIDWKGIQNNSVQLWVTKIDKLGLRPLRGSNDIFSWNSRYDSEFLGIMLGVLEQQEFTNNGGSII